MQLRPTVSSPADFPSMRGRDWVRVCHSLQSGAASARRQGSCSCGDHARLLGRVSMMRQTTPPQRHRTFTHADRQRLDRAAEHYLRVCYKTKTAARVSEFATFLGVSTPYLSRIVPEIVGKRVRDFLRAKQIEYAVQLLLTTPISVDEIALRCGFGTPWTFYRWFRKAYGVTPTAFREVMKGG